MIDNLSDLISGLGGAEATAEILSRGRKPIGAKAVYKWKQRGHLPGKWVYPLHEIARDRGLPVTIEALARMAQPESAPNQSNKAA